MEFTTSLNCVVCNKPNCDISDKTGRLYFCSDVCADNLEAIRKIASEQLAEFREYQREIKSLENIIRSNTEMMAQTGDYYNALTHYTEE